MSAEAIIVVGPLLWKCVNCNLLMSWQHSVDSHLLTKHKAEINPNLNLEIPEENFCRIVECSCNKARRENVVVVVEENGAESTHEILHCPVEGDVAYLTEEQQQQVVACVQEGNCVTVEDGTSHLLLNVVDKSDDANKMTENHQDENSQTLCLTFEKNSEDLSSTLCYFVQTENSDDSQEVSEILCEFARNETRGIKGNKISCTEGESEKQEESETLCGIVFEPNNETYQDVSKSDNVPPTLKVLCKLAVEEHQRKINNTGNEDSEKDDKKSTDTPETPKTKVPSPEDDLPKDYSIVAIHGFQIPARFADMGDGIKSFNLNKFLTSLPGSTASQQLINLVKSLTAYNIELTVREDGGFLFHYKKDGNEKSDANEQSCSCTICYKDFISVEKFMRHLYFTNHGMSPHMCGNCLCLFHNPFALHIHQLETHFKLTKNLPCVMCDVVRKDSLSIITHMNSHRKSILAFKGIETPVGLEPNENNKAIQNKKKVTFNEEKKTKEKKVSKVESEGESDDSSSNLENSRSNASPKKTATSVSAMQQKKRNHGFINVAKLFSKKSPKSKENTLPYKKSGNEKATPNLGKRKLNGKDNNEEEPRGKVQKSSEKKSKKESPKSDSDSPDAKTLLHQENDEDDSGKRRSSRQNKGRSSFYKEFAVDFP
ncbi:uncharacterized protein LOC131947278 [Physella acuta]|uniref:uncharacterized protein LOC131947278 n=1 Tax=Physella acuta TaxID=109671 RepID=UPI0027DB58F0|nr:uncharacterized protein LOC131947278 [Physella acuta]